ncbi:MAG: ASCH domain-containing protein [Ruminococcaceae bacterium]|nr:ASCH domain-containing protein [Oscillospiraceae bacterium]
MNFFEMHLHPAPFRKIARGEKTIELRLYDEKRSDLRPGDRIVFLNTEAPEEKVVTAVKALHIYEDFSALYAALPLTACGYSEEEAVLADPADMEVYYSKELQQEYGVVGIELVTLSRGVL